MGAPDSEMQLQWLEERLRHVRNRLELTNAKINEYQREATSLQSQYDTLVAWQVDLKHSVAGTHLPTAPVARGPVAEKYRDISTGTAIKRYAVDHGGVVVAREAIRELVAANFFTNPKNAQAIVFGILSRGAKTGRYRKERPGVYVLVSEQGRPSENGTHHSTTTGQVIINGVVQPTSA